MGPGKQVQWHKVLHRHRAVRVASEKSVRGVLPSLRAQ